MKIGPGCALVAGLVLSAAGAASAQAVADAGAVPVGPAPEPVLAPVAAPVDSPRVRPHAIEISDWYARRLAVHRVVAFATLPLFAFQWDLGERLYNHPIDSPPWVLTAHRTTAAALGGAFAVNTVTGLWNLWDSRTVQDHRTVRTIHALTMLTADAGFTYAGAKLGKEARNDLGQRSLHRKIALSSAGLTAASAAMMLIWNR